ncbi:hypothetical protein [uncultured Roseobacter sp.]|uniref:hypothetical protein n=1 Tax=uncultured Roseobacter sp. TaxID=114847 RepID=UPI002636283E|nr:hypothetical protein [uncultured Roseobacter sp.]
MTYRAVIGAALLALSSLGTSASAAETVYDCTASYRSPNGFIGPRVVFFIDEGLGTVRILDNMIQSVKGGPIRGEISSSSGTTDRLAWRVTDVRTTQGVYNIRYKATLNRKSGTYQMRAVGFNHRWRPKGEGSCTVSR